MFLVLTRTSGGLLAAGVTFGTAQMESTWAWRLPSLLQGVFSLMCIVLIPFVPESPRWLQHKGRTQEALVSLSQTYANGNIDDAAVLVSHKEIIDTLTFEEATYQHKSSFKLAFGTKSGRKRLLLAISVAVFAMLSGNNIISFYLGTMLTDAGVTDTTTQLEIVSLSPR